MFTIAKKIRSGSLALNSKIYIFFSFVCAVLIVLRPMNFISDDALFYLVIADNVSKGLGSTFNGLFPTNGYHPLWGAVASGLALIPHDKSSLLTFGILFQWLVSALAFCILHHSLSAHLGESALRVFTAVMVVLFVPIGNLYWSEGPLNFLAMALLFNILASEKPINYVWLGVVLGLAFLSRLDNVFLVGCACIGTLWRRRDLKIVISGALLLVIAGIYVLDNFVHYGHLVPISGAIKSSSYRGEYFSGNIGKLGIIGFAGAVGVLIAATLRNAASPHYRSALVILAGSVILQCIYIKIFTFGHTEWSWYYISGYICTAIFAGEILGLVPMLAAWRGRLGNVVIVGALTLSSGLAMTRYFTGATIGQGLQERDEWRLKLSNFVKQKIPDDQSVLVVFDQPGLFAFTTDHRIFAIDGLVSNYAVDQDLVTHGVHAEFVKLKAAYLLMPIAVPGIPVAGSREAVEGGQIFHFYAPLAGTHVGCLFLADNGLLGTYSVPSFLYGGTWGIWRLDSTTMREISCGNKSAGA